MKIKNYIQIAIPALIGITCLSSCLKDSRYVDFGASKNVIELPTVQHLGELQVASFPIVATPSPLAVLVNLASPKPSSSPITVTFTVDAAALTAYNHSQGLDTGSNVPYELLPAADYTSVLQVTIPAGQRLVNLNIPINSSAVDLTKKYALPLTITNGGAGNIISGNYKTVIYSIAIKNQYDGVYTIKGYVHRDADMALGGPIAAGTTGALATITGNSVSYTQDWADGNPAGGINPLILTINTATNAVAITSTVNASLTNIPSYNSRYDPAAKTFYLSFVWNGSDPNHRSATDTLVYSKSR